jgi:hypothetical protein
MKRSIELLLLKLVDGGRVLRFYEPLSGLCLEKRLEPRESVARQKERWERVFITMIERELDAVAEAEPQ